MKLLIVDDNKYVVEGLKRQLKWELLGIDTVFGCYQVGAAKEILLREPVDFLITDIEMPVESGFDLLEWVRQQGMDVETVLLTSYAEFSYAQAAVDYQCFRYLLKPVDSGVLEDVMLQLTDRRLKKAREKQLVEYGNDWLSYQSVAREIFWRDVMDEEMPDRESAIECRIKSENLPYERSALFGVALLCFDAESEKKGWSRELLSFACQNVMQEMAQESSLKLEAFCHNGSFQYALVLELGEGKREDAERFLRSFLEVFVPFYKGTVGCCIAEPCRAAETNTHLRRLEEIHLEHLNCAGVFLEWEEWEKCVKSRELTEKRGVLTESILEYISAHLDEVTRSQIAEAFFLSPNYLSKLFHKEMGIPLSEYIQKERIELAKTLLVQKELPISEIAFRTGYPSFAHFSRRFKKFVGVSPNEYRKGRG